MNERRILSAARLSALRPPAGVLQVHEELPRDHADPGAVEAMLGVERLRASRLPEADHAVTAYGNRGLGERLADGAPEAAHEAVVFDREDPAGPAPPFEQQL